MRRRAWMQRIGLLAAIWAACTGGAVADASPNIGTDIGTHISKSTGSGADQQANRCDVAVVQAMMRAAAMPALAAAGAAPALASACRTSPAEPALMWAAVVPASAPGGNKTLIVAVLQQPGNNVLAWHQRPIEEDAAMVVGPDSLRIDTAAYELAPGRRAFGVDLSSAYTPNCGEGEIGAARALYLRSGSALAEVLPELTLLTRTLLGERDDRCAAVPAGTAPAPPAFEVTLRSIAVAQGQSHGLRDLRITTTVQREEPGPRGRVNVARLSRSAIVWRFDGQQYRPAAAPRG